MNLLNYQFFRKLSSIKRDIYYSPLFFGRSYEAEIQKKLIEVFKITNQFLNSIGVEFWINYGTLLGYYRDKTIILGDRDVDFGLLEESYELILRSQNELPSGYALADTSYRHGGPKLFVQCVKSGFKADLNFHKLVNDQMQVFLNSRYIYDVKPYPEDYVFPLKNVTFLGENTFVMNKNAEYLKHTYHYLGKDGKQDKVTGYWTKGEAR